MTKSMTITNTTGSKEVRITNQDGTFLCYYGQNYKGDFQVLASKDYATIKGAEKWANKQLS
tara:strand:- start:658 stop:840 length:183 start_codon:yes stop_codon:yes gene_type:complete